METYSVATYSLTVDCIQNSGFPEGKSKVLRARQIPTSSYFYYFDRSLVNLMLTLSNGNNPINENSENQLVIIDPGNLSTLRRITLSSLLDQRLRSIWIPETSVIKAFARLVKCDQSKDIIVRFYPFDGISQVFLDETIYPSARPGILCLTATRTISEPEYLSIEVGGSNPNAS